MAESSIRLSFFLGLFFLFAFLEIVFPKRKSVSSKVERWSATAMLTLINTLSTRFLFPLGAVGVSIYAQNQNIGLFSQYESSSSWWFILSSIIFLDFIIYLQHVLFHHIGFLWQFHRVHHAEKDLDVSSGIRFHTIEILLSMAIKSLVILVFGLPPSAILIFEIILNGMAMFNHSNLRLNLRFDNSLRNVIVTPDMHRIHHSIVPKEAHSNFGFNLSIWDLIFNTYTAKPQSPQETLILGDPHQETPSQQSIWFLLSYPFKNFKKKGN